MLDLAPLLAPRSIAVIGASTDPGRVGGMPLALLLQHQYAGHVYPVNPKYAEVMGLRCYPDIESVAQPVDVAVLAIGAADVLAMLRRCHACNIRSAIVFAAGFAEAGEAGKRLQLDVERFVADTGMVVAGPNCMGFANLNTHAYTAFASVFKNIPPPAEIGDTALVTQSGNVCATVYSEGRALGVGFNYVVNTGNEACLEFSEYLEWLAEDAGTQCVVGYVEGLRNGERFCHVAERLRELDKPLILLKVGDSSKGREAAASHTAALAGDQNIYRAALRQMNVLMARDLAHMADLAYLARFKARSGGPRVAIVTMSGALGALLSDRFEDVGIQIPTLPDDVQAVLRSGIPDYGMVANPVDITGNIVNGAGFFAQALDAVLGCDVIDALVMYAPGYLLERLTPDLAAAATRSGKLLVVIDTLAAKTHATLHAAGIPVFRETGRAVQALGSFLHWNAGRARPWQQLMDAPQQPALARSLLESSAVLDEAQSKALLGCFGVPLPIEPTVHSAQEAAAAAGRLGFPCVLKVLSADIAHKTEVGGVRLNLTDEVAVRRAFDDISTSVSKLAPHAHVEGMLLSRQEQPVAEILVGITRDPVFGLVMTVGLGGVLTEIYQDVAHRLLPVSSDMANEMLRELTAWPLLDGFRGRPMADVSAACDAIAAIGKAALALGDRLRTLEVNPLMLRRSGHGVVAIDALLLLEGESAANDKFPSTSPGADQQKLQETT